MGGDGRRELARADGARRLIPWAAASALGGGAIAWISGGGARGGAAVAAAGLVFVLFLWTSAIPRCPECGARLPRGRGGGAGASPGERPGACPVCRARPG